MNIMAIVKKNKDIDEAESQVKVTLGSIPGIGITVLRNINTLVVNFPDSVNFEEIKKRLQSCDSIMPNVICKDTKAHLVKSIREKAPE